MQELRIIYNYFLQILGGFVPRWLLASSSLTRRVLSELAHDKGANVAEFERGIPDLNTT